MWFLKMWGADAAANLAANLVSGSNIDNIGDAQDRLAQARKEIGDILRKAPKRSYSDSEGSDFEVPTKKKKKKKKKATLLTAKNRKNITFSKKYNNGKWPASWTYWLFKRKLLYARTSLISKVDYLRKKMWNGFRLIMHTAFTETKQIESQKILFLNTSNGTNSKYVHI